MKICKLRDGIRGLRNGTYYKSGRIPLPDIESFILKTDIYEKLDFRNFSVPTGITRQTREVFDAREQIADLLYTRVSGIKAHRLAFKISRVPARPSSAMRKPG